MPAASAPINATPLRPDAIAKMVNPQGLPAYTGPTGSVEGIIRVEGPSAPSVGGADQFGPCPAAASVYGKLFREGPAGADGTRPVADAIVAITGYSGFYIPERQEAVTVTIEPPCAFDARTVAMTFGQRLEVKNNAKDYWAPIVDQLPMPALMLAPPNGDAVRLYPSKVGHFTIGDQMKHSWAKADLYVLLQPLHAVSDREGKYRIDGVPVGKLQVGARLTAIGADATKDVEVLAGVVQRADLVIKYTPKAAPAPAPATRGDAGAPAQQLK
jgi:hypothetical protein